MITIHILAKPRVGKRLHLSKLIDLLERTVQSSGWIVIKVWAEQK